MMTKTIESIIIDDHVKQILKGTFFQSKSIKDLSRKYCIPMTICSEKVQALERLGMLKCDHSDTTLRESSIKYYRSDISNAHVVCNPNKIFLRFQVTPKLIYSYPRWITVKLL